MKEHITQYNTDYVQFNNVIYLFEHVNNFIKDLHNLIYVNTQYFCMYVT